MLNFVNKAITAIFGSKHVRDMKELTPYVGKINAEWKQLTALSDDELRAKTVFIQQVIKDKLADMDTKIATIQTQTQTDNTLTVQAKVQLFQQIDVLEKERDIQLEKALIDVLPISFAVMKETARRLKENKQLKVTATDWDKEIASQKSNVVIEGEHAIWHNQWEAAGSMITWDMVHYDVQLIGGVVLHQGKVAEMATGEGKTLVATLPSFLNALAKRGVHIVTVNDYLSRRDSEWMAPLFEFHGLKIDCIDKHEPHTEGRKNAYLADITYGTNNEFGFDYLRDNMVHEVGEMVQKKHHFAMIDEVDSVLIDDARTPLIIAGPVPNGDVHEYLALKPRIQRIAEEQKKLMIEYLNEVKTAMRAGKEKEAGLPLFRAHRAMPSFKPLIKILSEPNMQVLLQKTENYYLQDNQKMMPEADKPLFFTIDEKTRQIDLTDKGLDFITKEGEDANFFVLPDIGGEIARMQADTKLTDEEKLEQHDFMIADFRIKSQRIHTIQQLLKAYTMFEKEVDYIIVNGEVKIVDEQTGRVLSGRRYSDGLHQALEAKENVRIQDETQTYATITLQNYFRMYHKLAGMTGTAETEAGELWSIYKLDVVVIPTNKPIIRKDQNDFIYKTIREKYNAVIDEIIALTQKGRPVLVGTSSVEVSELISRMLQMRKVNHQVLNAKLHQKEAEIVAEAGKSGTVTIATNMAGRGTDIKLTAESRQAGGLAIIGTERHESRRVDRQLRGRAGRQGDPGSSQFFVSLEDNLMRVFGNGGIGRMMDRFGFKEGEVIQHSWITASIERAQKKVEENNFGSRKRLLEYDDVMNAQRRIIYKRRKNALYGDRLEVDILNAIYFVCEKIVKTNLLKSTDAKFHINNLKAEIHHIFGIDYDIDVINFKKAPLKETAQKLYAKVFAFYQQETEKFAQEAYTPLKQIYEDRKGEIAEVGIPITDGKHHFQVTLPLEDIINTNGKAIIKATEKQISLMLIDDTWKEHLREMDNLKQSVQNAALEQKDPLLVYKFEAFNMFEEFLYKVNKDAIQSLFRAQIFTQQEIAHELPEVTVMPKVNVQNSVRNPFRNNQTSSTRTTETKADLGYTSSQDNEEIEELLNNLPKQEENVKQMPVRAEKLPNRNDKVNVQYKDGKIVRDVKFKTVEDDYKKQLCVLIG